MGNDKPLALFFSDKEAECFVGSADLTGYDLSALTPTRFQLGSSKSTRVKAKTASKGMSHQRKSGLNGGKVERI